MGRGGVEDGGHSGGHMDGGIGRGRKGVEKSKHGSIQTGNDLK